MAFDPEQIFNNNNEQIESQIAALQPLTKPQGGVLNQIDPTWLALAQGFLAPTKTGGFGESLSNAAGQLQGPLAQMKQQQMTAQDKINNLRQLQMKLQLDWYKAQQGDSEDSALSTLRALRSEKAVEDLYKPDLKDIDDQIKEHKKTIGPNSFATDADKATAQAEIDRLRGERSNLEAKIEEEKAKRGIAGRERRSSAQPKPAQSSQPQAASRAYKVDDIVVQDGKNYKVTKVDANGKVLEAEAQ